MSLPVKEFLGHSVLFEIGPIDLPDTVEHAHFYRYSVLKQQWSEKGETEVTAFVAKQATRSAEAYSDLMQGLLYGILSEATMASNYCVNDEWAQFIEQLKYYTYTRFLQTKTSVREQIFWIVARMVSLNIKGSDGLILGLLRQVKSGDRSTANMWLVKSLAALLHDNQSWIFGSPSIIPYVLYTFLRLLSENFLDNSIQKTLIEICAELLRQKYGECSLLGRDLVRCLLEVSQIAEFQQFWSWLLRPTADGSAPVSRLLLTPTPRKYLAMRLTPRMEADLHFLLETCKSAKQNFYIPLFLTDHLPSAPVDDCGAMVIDLIRYAVACFHPKNSVLVSPVIQRWAFIVALLKHIKTSYCAAGAKLALFLDWLFFDPQVDSIMCIEPGLLVIVKSIVNYPNITATLLDFLLLSRESFYPPMAAYCAECISRAFSVSVEKGVIPSIDAILGSPLLQENVKQTCRSLVSGSGIMGDALIDSINSLERCIGTRVNDEEAEAKVEEWLKSIRKLSHKASFGKQELEALANFINGKLSSVILASNTDSASLIWISALIRKLPQFQDIIPSTNLPSVSHTDEFSPEVLFSKLMLDPAAPLNADKAGMLCGSFMTLVEQMQQDDPAIIEKHSAAICKLAHRISLGQDILGRFLKNFVFRELAEQRFTFTLENMLRVGDPSVQEYILNGIKSFVESAEDGYDFANTCTFLLVLSGRISPDLRNYVTEISVALLTKLPASIGNVYLTGLAYSFRISGVDIPDALKAGNLQLFKSLFSE